MSDQPSPFTPAPPSPFQAEPEAPAQPWEKPANPFAVKKRAKNQQRLIWITSLLIIASVGIYLYSRSQRTYIFIAEDPSVRLEISLNGKKVPRAEVFSNGLRIGVPAGSYRVVVTRDQTLEYTEDIEARTGEQLVLRPSYLVRNTAAAESSSGLVNFVRPSQDLSLVYFLGNSGTRLFRYEVTNGKQTTLTDSPLQGVQDVQWNGELNQVITVQSGRIFLQELERYNFTDQKRVEVGNRAFRSPVWDPKQADRLAATYYPGNGEESLVLVDPLFRNVRRIADLQGIKNPRIVWSSDGTMLSLISQGATPAENNAWVIDLASFTLRKVTDQGSVTDVLFTPDAQSLIIEQINGSNNKQRSLLRLSDSQIQPMPGEKPLATIAWKNTDEYWEPNLSQGTVILRSLTKNTTEVVRIRIPNTEDAKSATYFSKTKLLLVTTNRNLYAVSLGSL
jgi:dipeptidyl aminopeptidase/acylaminoacyl peptidase